MGRKREKMRKTGIIVFLAFLLVSIGSPVQAKESRITLERNFLPGYAAGADAPLFAHVELAQPVRRGSSAESFVATLAQDERSQRIVSGGTLTGLGFLFIGLGVAASEGNSEVGTFFFVSGVITAGGGLYCLFVPGYVETQYKRIRKIEDPHEREAEAYAVLVHSATKAKVERLSSATFSGALCLYHLIAQPDYWHVGDTNFNTYNAIIFGASSLYYFLVKSPPERMLDEYEEAQKARGQLTILPRPDGSIAAVYTLAF